MAAATPLIYLQSTNCCGYYGFGACRKSADFALTEDFKTWASQILDPAPRRSSIDPKRTALQGLGIFAGSNLRSTFPITKGWCSPALPAKVYDLSYPFGPKTFKSQSSFSREPTMDTRQSPGLSLR
jgi:hypothetical protein